MERTELLDDDILTIFESCSEAKQLRIDPFEVDASSYSHDETAGDGAKPFSGVGHVGSRERKVQSAFVLGF